MIRNCIASQFRSHACRSGIIRVSNGFTFGGHSSQKDSHREHSSQNSNTCTGSSAWFAATTAGAVLGTVAYGYMLSKKENVAHCGSTDNWSFNKKPANAVPQASVEYTEPKSDHTNTNSNAKMTGSDSEEVGSLPSHVPYLIIGAGTAAMAAYRAIRTKHANATVLLIGEEQYKPYMRPPLSKDMWFTEDESLISDNKFKTWSGRERSLFFEKDSYYCSPSELSSSEKGGVAVATGLKVTKLNAVRKQATLSDGSLITFDHCLLATGGRPRNLDSLQKAGAGVMSKVTLFRGIDDFKSLKQVTDSAKSVVVIGGGFLGSELACALGKKSTKNGMKVTQVFPEPGNMGKVLPEYLSHWTTNKVRSEGVDVIPNVIVEKSRLSEDGQVVELLLNSGEVLCADHVVVAVGLEANTDLAESAGLEVDPRFGGFLVNAELEAASDIWVAGDAACFYDVKLGRRRVEHHDHAVVSGRLAGENMTGASKRFLHQSMFWSDLGPDVGYEAIGLVDSSLPTVAVFAKGTHKDTPASAEQKSGESLRSETEQCQAPSLTPEANSEDKFGKGVIFYMKGKKVVGVVCWNVFNKIGVARKIIKDGAEHEDLAELGKLFDLHPSSSSQESASS